MSDRDGLSRRGFLGTAAAGAILFGFPFAAWGDDKKTTQALEDALAAMKDRKQAGVVIVVPEKPADAAALGAQFEALIPVEFYPSREVAKVFLEAVWVAAPGDLALAKAGETAVLVDESGKRLAGAAVDFSSAEKFVETAKKLLDTDGRRTARIKTLRDAGVKKALEILQVDLEGNRAREDVEAHWDEWAPALFDGAKDQVGHAGPTIEQMAYEHWNKRAEGPTLPYGITWKIVRAPEPAPCPPCGRARVDPPARKFIDFLTKPE